MLAVVVFTAQGGKYPITESGRSRLAASQISSPIKIHKINKLSGYRWSRDFYSWSTGRILVGFEVVEILPVEDSGLSPGGDSYQPYHGISCSMW